MHRMSETTPRIEFALGSEVTPGNYFKSSFARAFASSRDAKSLEPGDAEVDADVQGGNVHNFHSLVNCVPRKPTTSIWEKSVQSTTTEVKVPPTKVNELENLRKQCLALTLENERLQERLRGQPPQVQEIDTVYLQTKIDTLEWQLKQSEANRKMCRSLMGQVVRFLDRSRKSLDHIHERFNGSKNRYHSIAAAKEKSRVPRSRSVHAVHAEHSESAGRLTTSYSCSSSTTSSSSSSSSPSHFSRAKSVAQIAPNYNNNSGSSGAFSWSVLRRNDSSHCAPPRMKQNSGPVSTSAQDVNKVQDGVPYRRPVKQPEIDPNDVPPEKLSQEAFRLMRTVQSLLNMREPDLARLDISQMGDNISLDNHGDAVSLTLQTTFGNSTGLRESTTPPASSSSDRGTEGSSTDDEVNRTLAGNEKLSTIIQNSTTASQQTLMMTSGARQSIDATSLNSAISKCTEEESKPEGQELQHNGHSPTPYPISSTPYHHKIKKTDRKELNLKSLRDWALGNSGGSVTSRPKPATSVSSAEDESGFSSLSSFQEVGLPNVSPIKGGCHTEVGLPEVPLDKVRHRRWSSTPVEYQAIFKRHSGSFASTGRTNTESVSVWV